MRIIGATLVAPAYDSEAFSYGVEQGIFCILEWGRPALDVKELYSGLRALPQVSCWIFKRFCRVRHTCKKLRGIVEALVDPEQVL